MLAAFLVLLTVSFFVNLSSAAPATESKNIWAVNIFRGPAPSPEDGPPASAHALRNPSKLKYEAIGIACAYLVWIAVTIVAVVLVGKRLRRRQQTSDQTLQMETIKPMGQVTLQEIHTGPKSPLSPKSPGKMSSIRSWARGNKGRQSDISVSTVNTKVDDRVIEHDRVRNMDDMAKLYAAVMAHDEERAHHKSNSSAGSSPITDDNTPVTPKSPTCPPQMAHPAYLPPVPQAYPQQCPQSSYDPMPPPPVPTDNDQASLLDNQASPRRTKNSALSIMSSTASRLGSSQSNKARPSPITVRGQLISKPLGSADLRQSAFSPSQTSVASSLYSPGPPPPTPGKTPAPVYEEIEMHGRPQLTLLANDSTANSSSKALPFRQFYQDSALKSAPPTKTTFLDRRASAFNGPKTGVPKTPYSPYCPSTPMTPVTPRRLLGKEELKKNKKQYALKVVKENDLVQDDDDMWGTDR